MFRINTEVITFIIRNIFTTDNTFLAHITHRKSICGSLRSTGYTQCIALGLGIILEHGINPIGIINTTIFIMNRLDASPIVSCTTAVQSLFVHDGHVLLGIQHFSLTSHILDTIICIERYLCLTLTALLCSYQHYTIGSLSTINSSRSGILQHVDTFDIGGIQGRNITTYTVNQIKRAGTTSCTQTTNLYLHAFTWLTGSRSNAHTRSLSLHGLQRVSSIQFRNVITFYLNGSTGNQFLLHGTITNNHHFFQSFGIFFQSYVQCSLIGNGNTLCYITDVRENKDISCFYT